jgi:ATP-dependent Clp protease, protease subunit
MQLEIRGVIVPNNYEEVYDWFGMENTSPRKVNKALRDANGEAVDVLINSGGGMITAGSEIYSALKNYAGEVNIRIVWAASAASVIAMSRHSVMEPTAMMMIHNVSSVAEGDYRDMEHESKVLDTASAAMSVAYQLKTGKSEAEIRKLMDKETWFTAREAQELGFVDEVAENGQMAAAYSVPLLPREAVEKAVAEIADFKAAAEKFERLGGSE